MGTPINPADIEFSSPACEDCPQFDCDNHLINTWFSGSSQGEHGLYNCSVRHVRLKGEPDIVGFYALKLVMEPKSDFVSSKFAKALIGSDKITAIHLQWLAVRAGFERRQIGTVMVGRVLDDAYGVIKRVGAHALTVKYMGSASERLYRKSGFADYAGPNDKQLFMSAAQVIEFIDSP